MIGRAWRWAIVLTALSLTALPPAALAGTGPVLIGSRADATDLSATVSVAVSGNYAYTTAYHSGELTAIDISNPSAPTIAGHSAPFLDTNLIGGSNVAIAGGYAFVVSKNRNASTTSNDDGNGNSLTILDVHSDPANPSIVGTIRSPTQLFGAYGIAVHGSYAYVAYQGRLSGQPGTPDTSFGGFSVIDLSTLGSPKIVASIDDGSIPAPYNGTNAFYHATSVAISGNYAYVNAFYGNRITVIDISSPTTPKIVASLKDATNFPSPVDLAVQNGYLYVANQVSGSSPQLTVVDVSTPTSPHVVAALSDSTHLGGAYRIRVRASFAYESASSANAIAAIDISDPLHPRVAGDVIDNTHLHRTTGLDLDPTGAYVIASSPYLSTESNSTYPPYPLQTGGATNTGTISVVQLDPNPIAVTISPASEPPSLTASTSASFTFASADDVSTVRCQLDSGGYGSCTSPTSAQYSGLSVGTHTFSVQATDALGNTTTSSYTWQIGTAPANASPPTIDAGAATEGQTINLTSNGAWNSTPSPTYSYQWDRCDQSGNNCAPITGQTGASYTAQRADVGSTVAVTVTATNGLGFATSTSAVTAIVTGAPVNTGAPTISGTVAVGSQLSASSGSWAGYPVPTYVYQWSDCSGTCTPIGGATGSTYTVQPSDVGDALQVVVTAANGVGSPGTASAETAVVGGMVPQNTQAPSVAGTATFGATLTASPGTWSGVPAPSLSYAWDRCDQSGANCVAIGGATSSSYTVQRPDVGGTLVVVVTGSNSVGSQSANSQATSIVTGAPVNTSAPAISGVVTQGATLTASPGTWSASPAPSFAYVWSRCSTTCVAISGATGSTYVATRADMGDQLMVGVTATNSLGSAAASSAQTSAVTAPPANSVAPTVSGTPVQGNTLTGTLGTWTGYPTPTLSISWQRCTLTGCPAIAGATSTTYVLTAADVGAQIRVSVKATNSAGTLVRTSTLTAKVASGATATIAGMRQPARVRVLIRRLGADTELILSPPVGARFVGSLAALARGVRVREPGGRTLHAAFSLRGGRLFIRMHRPLLPVRVSMNPVLVRSIRVLAHRRALAAGVPRSTTVMVSLASAPQPSASAPVNTSPPTVSGSRTQGVTLTASRGSWTGTPYPSFSYQWERCSAAGENCLAIPGAITSGYGLQRADVGETIAVVVTASNSAGSAAASSPTTRIISGPPIAVIAPSVSGQPMQGTALKADLGTWTGYPIPTLAIRWQRCNATKCSSVAAGVTSYVVTAADIGHRLRVSVRASNNVGLALSTSRLTARAVSNATATITGVRRGADVLRLTAHAAGHGALLKELDIELPTVMRFGHAAVAGGVIVRDGHNRLVRAQLALAAGRLVIRWHTGLSTVHITVDSAALQVKSSFVRGLSGHRTSLVVLRVKVVESARVRTYDALAVHVS